MVVRTYFDKNNTIIYNDTINTGKNPVAELFYGGESDDLKYSRFLFHFDETRIKDFYTGGTFADITKLTHTLRMTNTGAFDTDLLGNTDCGDKKRTCSFDLIVFPIAQDWDEGVGYDYGECRFIGGVGSTSTCPSNWTEAETNVAWSGGNGVYSGSPTVLATQHFADGNENIEIDITSYVNAILTGDTNYGFGIAYARTLEATPTDKLQYTGFFTRHTQTFYEPYLETSYNCTIQDDRADFYLDKNNKLYLYVNIGGNPTNLDSLPSQVQIKDHEDNVYTTIPQSGITHVTKGVYSVDVNVPTTTAYTDCLMFTDVWSGLTINGVNRPDAELEFALKAATDYYNIGADTQILPKKYGFSVTGIKRDERVIGGDIRKIIVNANIPYTINQKEVIDNLQYRLYIKEGKNEYTIIDYRDVDRAFNHNYFLLDTATLVPLNTYYLDVKVTSNNEVTTIKDVISFDIVSRSDLRKSQ
jgi:hypothetical protein